MKSLFSTIIFTLLIVQLSFAQVDNEVARNLDKLAAGQTEEVRYKLLDLLAEYPNEPGVMLLHGAVIGDAFRAVEIYKKILREHESSKWADDAFWRIIQFYSILGDTTQARISLIKFRQKFPTSEFLAPATDVVTTAVGIARKGDNQTRNFAADDDAEREIIEEEMVDPSLTRPVQPEKRTNKDILKKEEEIKAARERLIKQRQAMQDEVAETENKSQGAWGLQVAIFRSKDAADEEKKEYLKQRLWAQVLEKIVGSDIMYAVVIGNYPTKEDAEQSRTVVARQCSCDPIVFKK